MSLLVHCAAFGLLFVTLLAVEMGCIRGSGAGYSRLWGGVFVGYSWGIRGVFAIFAPAEGARHGVKLMRWGVFAVPAPTPYNTRSEEPQGTPELTEATAHSQGLAVSG